MADVNIRVADLPEVLWDLRKQLANILRDAARNEDKHTAKRLEDIAAAFEVAATEE